MKELRIVVSIVTIMLNGKATFSNMCDLCMKKLLIVVSFVTIRLTGKDTNMCDLFMKELLIVVSIVTIRLNGDTTFSYMCNQCMKELLFIFSFEIFFQHFFSSKYKKIFIFRIFGENLKSLAQKNC